MFENVIYRDINGKLKTVNFEIGQTGYPGTGGRREGINNDYEVKSRSRYRNEGRHYKDIL